MPVEEARDFFTEKPVKVMLDRLADVGLGYVSLGQELDTLSGGERQRLKLAIEMSGDTEVYVLDEPTTGLHMQDVENLVGLLDRLVDAGRTVIVIEHNLDVVARADWVIDLGPGGGHDGGRVIFEGPPADLIRADGSLTGRYLRRRLESDRGGPGAPGGLTEGDRASGVSDCHVDRVGRVYSSTARREDVTMDDRDWLAERFEANRLAPARRRLPDARFPDRGGRRRPGSVDPPEPGRHERCREPAGLADDRRRPGLPQHAAVAQDAPRSVPGDPRPGPDRESGGRASIPSRKPCWAIRSGSRCSSSSTP